jgi:hypothetical protein
MQTKALQFLLSYFLFLTYLLTFRVKLTTIESAVIQNHIKESNIKSFNIFSVFNSLYQLNTLD